MKSDGGIGIVGIGTALPGKPFTQEAALEHAAKLTCQTGRQIKVLSEIYRRTGISTRSSVLAAEHEDHRPFFNESSAGGPTTAERMQRYAEASGQLALVAAQRVFDNSDREPRAVSHLVTVSCTGFVAPGFDISLIQNLPLTPSVSRLHVGFMGCHGLINALKVARSIVAADKNALVLVCASEICSLHFQYQWTSHNLLGNALFSDGAAACLVAANANSTIIRDGASTVVPDTLEAICWNVGNNGFSMKLDATVPEIIERALNEFMVAFLRKNGLDVCDVRSWAVHPGGPRILNAVERALALPNNALDASRAVLSAHGNMSSPTVLFVYEKLKRQMEKPEPCVMLGFGPGLTIETLLLA